jgi:hypothetical protein
MTITDELLVTLVRLAKAYCEMEIARMQSDGRTSVSAWNTALELMTEIGRAGEVVKRAESDSASQPLRWG